jgi:Na+/melibiose symporter-like transporter
MFAIALISGVAFFWRQATVREPLFDLKYAARSTFWVAAVSGIIVFGSLMGAMFVGQQFLQNVLDYNTLEAGLAILPCVILMVVTAPMSSRLIARFGSRITLLIGFALCTLGFVSMYALWTTSTPVASVVLSYALIGAGVGIAGTPASHSLTASVPVTRVGMASGTGDLQRDLGGAIMQSLLGAILGASYAASVAAGIAAAPADVQAGITTQIGSQLRSSFGSASDLAAQFPQYSDAIVSAARASFLAGSDAAYLTGIAAMLVGAALTWIFYPRKAREEEMFAQFEAERAN